MLIVCCSEISDPEWRWIAGHFPEDKAQFEFVNCIPQNWIERRFRFLNLARMRGSFSATWRAKRGKASVLVTHGPTLAAWYCIFANILQLRSDLVAHSFNFTELPGAIKTRVFALALRRIDLFIVFSRREIELYAKHFKLPNSYFSFVHWGIRTPTIGRKAMLPRDSYISAIGGNARDYRTLLDAARLHPDIPFLLVVRPSSLDGLAIPPNVTVHVNLALDTTMRLLSDSRFMILPLTSSDVPCGHVTIVAAMHLGKTMIATDSTGILDYIKNGENALTVPHASTSDMVQEIRRLWDDNALRRSLETNAFHFVTAYCTETNIAQHFENNVLLLQQKGCFSNLSRGGR